MEIIFTGPFESRTLDGEPVLTMLAQSEIEDKSYNYTEFRSLDEGWNQTNIENFKFAARIALHRTERRLRNGEPI